MPRFSQLADGPAASCSVLISFSSRGAIAFRYGVERRRGDSDLILGEALRSNILRGSSGSRDEDEETAELATLSSTGSSLMAVDGDSALIFRESLR